MKTSRGFLITDVDMSLIDEPKCVVRMEIEQGLVEALASSIAEIGLLQPILLRKDGDRFEIVAGHRRFLAHKHLKLKTIKSIIKVMNDQEAAFSRATENLARVDLTPIEEAAIFSDLIENHKMNHEEVGKKVGKSGGLVKRRIDLLRMPPQLQKALHARKISISVAEELWPITDLTQLDYYLSFALEGGCTSIVARDWCKAWKDAQRRKQSDIGGGGIEYAVNEPRPTYLPCDLCAGPVELGKDKLIRTCPKCFKTLVDAMKGVE